MTCCLSQLLPTTVGCCETCVSNEDLSQLLRAANISISFMQKLLAISFMRFLLWYFFSGLFHATATTPNGVWRRRFSSDMESHRRQECLQTPSTYITFLLPLLYGSFSNVFLFTFSCQIPLEISLLHLVVDFLGQRSKERCSIGFRLPIIVVASGFGSRILRQIK